MFTSSHAKTLLRRVWDAPIIKALSEGIVRGQLNYFGLPGANLEDIRDWRPYIGEVFALEREKADAAVLTSNAMVLDLHRSGFKLEVSELDEFILRAINDGESRLRLRWYHLVNLDYTGGWIYKGSTGDAKRIQALDDLAQMQREAFFEHSETSGGSKGYGLLLMTVNVRSDDRGELPKYIRERIVPQIKDAELQKAIVKLPERGQEHWLIRYYVIHNVPGKLCGKGFNIYTFPPVSYHSGQSILVHFVFVFGIDRSLVGAGQTVQPADTLLRLPLLTLERQGGDRMRIVRVGEPSILVNQVAEYHGVERYVEEVVSLQRRGAL